MSRLIYGLLCLCISNNSFAQEGGRYNILFKPGQIKLTTSQEKEIKDIAKSSNPEKRIMIFPLTYDSAFDQLIYAPVAFRQGNEIAEYAKSIGFEVQGVPQNFPSSYDGRSVAVSMKFKGAGTAVSSLKKHYPEKPSQFFLIDPKKDTLITGNEGTKLLFRAGSLMTSKQVEVELKEFYSLGDYMKGGLPTVSNGEMIVTGGSIYLNAIENDAKKKQVRINQDKGLKVDFTIGKDDPEMQIFVQDPRSASMNWILPPKRRGDSSYSMTETIFDASGKVVSKTTYSREEWQAHLKEEKAKEETRVKEEAERERLAEIARAAKMKIDSKLEILQFGNINCDRFMDEPMIAFALPQDKTMGAEYFLVYQDVRGVMNGNVLNGQVDFGLVPKNRKAMLVAVSFIGKQAYYFEQTIADATAKVPGIILKPVDESFLNQRLASLK